MRRAALVAAVALLVASTAGGNEAPRERLLDPGARVRVTFLKSGGEVPDSPGAFTAPTADRLRRTGRLIDLSADSLIVDFGGPPARLPLGVVTGFEVSRERHAHAGRGALIGFLAGAAGGAIVGLIVCADGYCRNSGFDATGLVPVVLGTGGAVVGAGTGALVGSFFHTDVWQPVSIRPRHAGEP